MNTQPRPFDVYAQHYDEHFTQSNIGRLQREQVWNVFASLRLPPQSVLEINCGTGEDALHLAGLGHSVIATDASARMVDAAQKKLTGAKAGIRFEQVDFLSLKERFEGKKFDLIFSNFGGLNCATAGELEQLVKDFDELLNQNGRLFFVVMGTNCKWEQLYFTLKGDNPKAIRRKDESGVVTNIPGSVFNTYYYQPQKMKKIFSVNFEVEKVRPIGLFVPPSYLETFFKKHLLLLKSLSWMDKVFGSFGFAANYADHFVLVMRKKSINS